jgi:hypothetical protein
MVRPLTALTIVLIILLLATAPLCLLPAPVQAADVINLELDSEGATSWNVTDIKPCFSGTKTVTLKNTGTASGTVSIWISDIISTEGLNPEPETGDTAEPGELDRYLLLGVTANNLSTNLTLPTTVNNFPTSAADTKYIRISPLGPGATVTLTWVWQLPCQTGNEVQGDTLSFAIKYMLEEELPPPPPATGDGGGNIAVADLTCPLTLTVNMAGRVATTCMTTEGVLCGTVVASDATGKNIFTIENGARVILSGNIVPQLITVREATTIPPAPENAVIVGKVYDFNAYPSDSVATPSPISISPPAKLVLGYDPDELPQNTAELFIGYYDAEKGWLATSPIPGFVAREGEAHCLVSHFTPFAVLASMSPLARFEVSGLTISPSLPRLNQEITISLVVTNIGKSGGHYIVELKVNGIPRSSKEVTLAAGGSQKVSFTITADAVGKHRVEVAGLTGEFEVAETVAKPSASPWVIGVTVSIILALVIVSVVASRRLKKGN